jgi:hypothetical protein
VPRSLRLGIVVLASDNLKARKPIHSPAPGSSRSQEATR